MPTSANRRRYPRFKIPPLFRVKARVRPMGQTATYYFGVGNLSLGGANLISQKGVPFQALRGDAVEILFFSGPFSLRCVGRIAQGNNVSVDESGAPIDGAQETEIGDFGGDEGAQMLQDGDDGPDTCVQLGIEIIGIDERSRKILADFLEKISSTNPPAPAPA